MKRVIRLFGVVFLLILTACQTCIPDDAKCSENSIQLCSLDSTGRTFWKTVKLCDKNEQCSQLNSKFAFCDDLNKEVVNQEIDQEQDNDVLLDTFLSATDIFGMFSAENQGWVCVGNKRRYLLPDNTFGKTDYCANGCRNGKCLDEPSFVLESCQDSDGGKNYYESGTVTSVDESGEEVIMFDSCSTARESFLNEQFCSRLDGRHATFEVYCRSGCKDGACLLKAAAASEIEELEKELALLKQDIEPDKVDHTSEKCLGKYKGDIQYDENNAWCKRHDINSEVGVNYLTPESCCRKFYGMISCTEDKGLARRTFNKYECFE